MLFWISGEGGRTAGADRVGSLLQADASCHKKIDELFSGKLYLIGIAAIVVAVIMVSITTVGMGSGKLDLHPADQSPLHRNCSGTQQDCRLHAPNILLGWVPSQWGEAGPHTGPSGKVGGWSSSILTASNAGPSTCCGAWPLGSCSRKESSPWCSVALGILSQIGQIREEMAAKTSLPYLWHESVYLEGAEHENVLIPSFKRGELLCLGDQHLTGGFVSPDRSSK